MGRGKPSDAERKPMGSWIFHGMAARGWTARQLRDVLAEQGYKVAVNTVQQWSLGNLPPARAKIPLIEAVLERPAPKEPEPDTLRLVAALEKQAEQMAALTSELRRLVSRLEPEAIVRTSRGLARAALEAAPAPTEDDPPGMPPPRPRPRTPPR